MEITKELSELLARQLRAMEDEAFLGRNDGDDVSLKRSERNKSVCVGSWRLSRHESKS